MEHVRGEGHKNFSRRRETPRLALANRWGGRGLPGEAESLTKQARSRKSIMALARAFLLNAKETRDRTITRIALMRSAGTGESVSGSIMGTSAHGADNYLRRARAAFSSMAEAMAASALNEKGAFLKNRRTNNLTKKVRGILENEI